MRKRAKPVEVRLDARTSKRVGFLLHLVTIELKYEPFAYVISLQKAKLNVMKIVYHGLGRAWCVFLSTHGTSRKALDQAPNLGKTWFERNRGHSQARSSAYYSMLQPCLNTFLFRSLVQSFPDVSLGISRRRRPNIPDRCLLGITFCLPNLLVSASY